MNLALKIHCDIWQVWVLFMFSSKDIRFPLPVEKGQDSVSSRLSCFLEYEGHCDTVVRQIKTIPSLLLGLLSQICEIRTFQSKTHLSEVMTVLKCSRRMGKAKSFMQLKC